MELLAIHPVICVDCKLDMIEISIKNLGPDYKRILKSKSISSSSQLERTNIHSRTY